MDSDDLPQAARDLLILMHQEHPPRCYNPDKESLDDHRQFAGKRALIDRYLSDYMEAGHIRPADLVAV